MTSPESSPLQPGWGEIRPRGSVKLHPWERPIGDPRHQRRDISAASYDRQERRAAKFLFDVGFGGGDDPIGFLITSTRYNAAVTKRLAKAVRAYFRIYDNPINGGGIPLSEITAARNVMRDALAIADPGYSPPPPPDTAK